MDLWLVIAPILVADVLNPVLLAAVIYELGSARPFSNASALLAGHTVAYFGAGVALGVGIEAIEERLRNPEPIDFGIELVLGVALLGVGLAMARGRQAKREFESGATHGPLASFGMGMVVNLIGLPFAVPYFAVIAQILKADLAWGPALGVLGIYNVLYALPFVLVMAARWVYREKAKAPLRRLNEWIDRASAVLVPVLLLALGVLFVLDGVLFFSRGQALFEL